MSSLSSAVDTKLRWVELPVPSDQAEILFGIIRCGNSGFSRDEIKYGNDGLLGGGNYCFLIPCQPGHNPTREQLLEFTRLVIEIGNKQGEMEDKVENWWGSDPYWEVFRPVWDMKERLTGIR